MLKREEFMATQKQFVHPDLQDYALLQMMKTFRRLQFLDRAQNDKDEVTKLRHYIGMFVHRALDMPSSKQIDVLFEKYPEILDIADERNPEKANELTKQFLLIYHRKFLDSIPAYKKLAEGNCETVILNAQQVYKEIFAPEVKQYNKTRSGKNSPIDIDQFVISFMHGEIDERMKQKVSIIKEKVLQKIYIRKQNPKKSIFQQELNRVASGLKITYKTSGNTKAVQQANEKVRAYSSKTDAETYRANCLNPAKQYQPDFDLPPKVSGPKEDFLKLVGSMAAHGYNMIHKGITPSKGNFDDFCSILQKRYPKNKNIVSTVLGLVPDSDRTAQFEAFSNKSAAAYIQMFGGFMQLRHHIFPNKPATSNTVTSIKKYINGLQDGVQKIEALDLLQKDDGKTGIHQQLRTQQLVNGDHKFPVACAISMYLALHPELNKPLDPNMLNWSQLSEIIPKAAALVDNLSNYQEVIGKQTNDIAETRGGEFILNNQKDNSVLACCYSPKDVIRMVEQIDSSDFDAKTKKRYVEALQKYSKADSRGIIGTSLNLPEHNDIARARQEHTTDKKLKNVHALFANVLEN